MSDCTDPTTALLRAIAAKDAKIESDAKVIAELREGIADAIRDLLASRNAYPEGDVIERLKGTLELAATYEQLTADKT